MTSNFVVNKIVKVVNEIYVKKLVSNFMVNIVVNSV